MQKTAPAELMLLFFNNLPKRELGLDHIKGKDLTCENGIGKACYSAMRKLQKRKDEPGAQQEQVEAAEDDEQVEDEASSSEEGTNMPTK